MSQPFWQSKSLSEMSAQEWESLCDGCGKCCLNKLEDEDTGDIYYTDVACRYLDAETCRCSDYANRQENVPTCLTLTPAKLQDYQYLPQTCAYRLLAAGKPLYAWHPLISGGANSIHEAGMSVAHRTVSEVVVDEQALEEHIIHWVV